MSSSTIVMVIVAGKTCGPEPFANMRDCCSAEQVSPFEGVPRPVTEAEMGRFANELNGFLLEFGQ